MSTVGIAQLRQNLGVYLCRAERGERLVVTDRGRPVAELGPPPATGEALDRLIGDGRVSRPLRRGLPHPLSFDGDARPLSTALAEVRGSR
jgi:prevent-host-death family protein